MQHRSHRFGTFLRALTGIAMLSSLFLVGCAPDAQPLPTAPPTPAPSPRPPSPDEIRAARAAEWVASASTRELAGSVIMATAPTTDAAQLRELMAATGLGGFIVMGANVPGTPEELAALTAQLTVDRALPPLIGIDEEGGLVTRLPWDTFPGADTLRAAAPADAERAFSGRAALLRDVGVNVNFGIVADVTGADWSFIYSRTLGDSGPEASPRVAAAVTGERGTVASTLKHFPGHGATHDDSHTAIPRTDLTLDAWRADAMLPFAAGIDAGAELLMFGHLAYTQVTETPASLAPEWYEIAREELGFTGVAVTDDLGMLRGLTEHADPAGTAVAALAAGADLALTVIGMDAAGATAIVDGVTAAVESGALPEARLREAATRVVTLRLRLAE